MRPEESTRELAQLAIDASAAQARLEVETQRTPVDEREALARAMRERVRALIERDSAGCTRTRWEE
jgi:citrate lyase gamma subunit